MWANPNVNPDSSIHDIAGRLNQVVSLDQLVRSCVVMENLPMMSDVFSSSNRMNLCSKICRYMSELVFADFQDDGAESTAVNSHRVNQSNLSNLITTLNVIFPKEKNRSLCLPAQGSNMRFGTGGTVYFLAGLFHLLFYT